MRVVLAGGTGFIGRRVAAALEEGGEEVTLLVRRNTRTASGRTKEVEWDGKSGGAWEGEVDGADAVINLSGASIAGKRWSTSRKEILRSSRIDPTRALVSAMRKASRPPLVLINASAVGYYGNVQDGDVAEESTPGSGFLPALCAEWEAEALKAREVGVRVVCLRTGIVLDAIGGALPKMLLPFRLWVGGPIGVTVGRASQWFPWIHVEDLVGAILFLLRGEVSGPVNCTAPNPVRMTEFSRTLGSVLRRPSWLPVPSFVLRLLLGEMAAVLLEGQKAIPAHLLRNRYPFRYPELSSALRQILSRP